MTAEEIIERLLDERKISAKEAIVLLKAIINVVTDDWIGRFKKLIDESNKKAEEERKKNSKPNDVPWAPAPQKQNPWIGPDIVVCYGVQIPDYTVANVDSNCTSSAIAYTWNSDGSCDASIKVNN